MITQLEPGGTGRKINRLDNQSPKKPRTNPAQKTARFSYRTVSAQPENYRTKPHMNFFSKLHMVAIIVLQRLCYMCLTVGGQSHK
jgi:hypothetical protein